MGYRVQCYQDKRGRKQADEWINDPKNASFEPSILARIKDLTDRGPDLSPSKLVPIEPRGKEKERIHGFYELKHRDLGWRIAVYYDQDYKCFFMLNGFRKGEQTKGIRRAYKLVREYLSRRNEIYK